MRCLVRVDIASARCPFEEGGLCLFQHHHRTMFEQRLRQVLHIESSQATSFFEGETLDPLPLLH